MEFRINKNGIFDYFHCGLEIRQEKSGKKPDKILINSHFQGARLSITQQNTEIIK